MVPSILVQMTVQQTPLTRRGLLALLLAAKARRAEGAESPAQPARLLQVERLTANMVESRNCLTFRAGAAALLFSIPVWSRANVGGGRFSLDYREGPLGGIFVAEFAGGANPERAKGLRNTGFHREAVVEARGCAKEAAYFGYMTSFSHESPRQARQALASSQDSLMGFSAVEGLHRVGQSISNAIHFRASPASSPADWSRLAQQAKTEILVSDSWKTQDWVPQSPSQTLFYLVWRAACGTRTSHQVDYAYNGRSYTLNLDLDRDESMAHELASRGISEHPELIHRIRGCITPKGPGSRVPFSVWYEKSPNPLPLRIEWQPRSFLRLSFEAESILRPHAVLKEAL